MVVNFLIHFDGSFEQNKPPLHRELKTSLKVGVYQILNSSAAITDKYSGYDNMANLPTDRLQYSLSFRHFLPEPHAEALVQF